MNTHSIQFKLLLWYNSFIVIILLIFGAYTYYRLYNSLYEEYQDILTQRVEHLRNDVLPEIAHYNNEELVRKIQSIYSPERNERFIRISDAGGRILYVSGPPRENSFDPAEIPLPATYTERISERLKYLRLEKDFMLLGVVSGVSGKNYIFEAGASSLPIKETLDRLLWIFLVGAPFLIVITVLVGRSIVRRAMRPIEMISATAEHIGLGPLPHKLPVAPTGDAIERLSQTLNQMLERLDQTYEQARLFSAEASHELRTPLAIIRGSLESLLREERLPRVLNQRIGDSLEGAERLSNIVEGMLAMVRLDTGEAKARHELFDLANMARETLEQMQLLGEEKQISISIIAAEPAPVVGDPLRLKQVIVNLLDNGIKYTMPGGTIVVSIETEASSVVMRVRDSGIGISAEDLPHVFDRFYRSDKARSADIQGTGLGLSIVHAICHAHGGTVEATSQEGTGTIIEIRLPLADITHS